ncbi:MAG: VCBS repeat-containing protein [Thermodesulfobacteriota bacterium]
MLAQEAPGSDSIKDFIIAHHPEYVDVHPEEIESRWNLNGWEDLDLDETGAKDYRIVFYTSGASGAVLVFRREVGNYRLIWETGPQRRLGTGVGTGISALDIDGDGRPEIHLSTSTHRAEAHYLFRWDREKNELVSLLAGEDPEWPYGAFGGSSVVFADFDNDGRLEAMVNEDLIVPDRPMSRGPGAGQTTLWRFDGTKFEAVETRRTFDIDDPSVVNPYLARYTDIEVKPKAWRQSWLTGQGPGSSVEGQEHRHVVFYLGGVEDNQYRLDQVDRASFRVAAPQGTLLAPVRPQSALLKAAEADPASGNQGVGGPRIEVTFLVGDLLEMARAPQPVPDHLGRVCFDLQSNLTGQPGLVRAWACLPVSAQ